MCNADVPPSHFHKICFPLQSWILLCSGVIKSSRSLVCISLLLLLPNLQFHWPPSLSPVWPPSTSNSDCKFDPQRRTRSGWGGWASLSCWDGRFHVETYACEFIQLRKCISFDCILKRSHLPLIPLSPHPPHFEAIATLQVTSISESLSCREKENKSSRNTILGVSYRSSTQISCCCLLLWWLKEWCSALDVGLVIISLPLSLSRPSKLLYV